MSLQPKTYAEALERALPQKARKPMRRKTSLTASQARPSTSIAKAKDNGNSPARSPIGLKRVRIKKSAGKKHPRKLTTGQLKKRVWTQFSIFIRTRDSNNGLNQCVTCGTVKPWKELQAGHFLRGRLNANLFDERGCWPQCYQCNISFQGNVVFYYEWMMQKFGPEVIAELKAQNTKTHKWAPGELQTLLDYYTALNQQNPLVENSS